MGSNSFSSDHLPSSTSPSLVLTLASETERIQSWTLTHPMWGPALTLDSYLARESYLTTVPLAKDGGITHWILTIENLPPNERPILSSCETLRKRVLYTENGELREGVAHGIGSVFTAKEFRGRGYASRMMSEVGSKLRSWQRGGGRGKKGGEGGEEVVLSVLYSDIGKGFYAKHGWGVFESSHVEFRPAASDKVEEDKVDEEKVKRIGYHELAELCCVDEKLLRGRLLRLAKEDKKKKVHVAVVPELDQMLWHLMREDFMTKHIFGKMPQVKGAVAGEKGKRVWAVWTRGYYGGLEKMEGNTLHILRVVIEDEEGTKEEELVEGLRAIIKIAQSEAAEWRSETLQMWNPSERLKGAIDKTGISYQYVHRDKDSIASLMWYGSEATDEVDWVANEKYAWC
ncbi:lysine acetyltransferase [Cladorrhinum sp. PSN259]|nr:lysine acetyltransferase [Cladorrhinum sp. PSN259]